MEAVPGAPPPEVTIRAGTDGDYAALCVLYRQADRWHAAHVPHCFRDPGEQPRSREAFAEWLADDTATLLVAERAGEAVAFVRVTAREAPDLPLFVPRRYAMVHELVVHQDWQRRGLGRLLMERAHDWARERQIEQVELTVYEFNAGALALYESLGYAAVSRRLWRSLKTAAPPAPDPPGGPDAPAAARGAPTVKRKAFAYVTHRDAAGERLLIFSHPNAPAAGLQVPAGTLEDGEAPEAGALREAREETGLTELEVVAFLGEQVRDMRDVGKNEVHHRHFFHLRCTGHPPERWYAREDFPSDQVAAGQVTDRPLFECFWVPLPDGVPALVTDHCHFLPRLISRLQPPPPRPD